MAYTLPSQATTVTRIEELYETETETKMSLLQNANAVTLTRDHWTSVSNQNYLGVTAHHIDMETGICYAPDHFRGPDRIYRAVFPIH